MKPGRRYLRQLNYCPKLNDLPDLHEVYAETLEDLKNYNGKFIVK